MTHRHHLTTALAVTLLACGAPSSSGADGGGSNAEAPDSGAAHAGAQDGGGGDAGTADAGTGSDDAGTADAGTVSYAGDVQPIWNTYCVSCHNTAAATTQGRIDLSAPGSRERLLQPFNGFCITSGGDQLDYDLVEPGDPEQSVLWIKLTTDLLVPTTPQCGREMPMGSGLAFTEPEDAAKIRAWIEQGALDN